MPKVFVMVNAHFGKDKDVLDMLKKNKCDKHISSLWHL